MLQPWLAVKRHFEIFLNVANGCTDHVICVGYPPLLQESSLLCCFSSSASWLRCFGWWPDKKAPTKPMRQMMRRTTIPTTVPIWPYGWRSLWPSERRRRCREEGRMKDWRALFEWQSEESRPQLKNVKMCQTLKDKHFCVSFKRLKNKIIFLTDLMLRKCLYLLCSLEELWVYPLTDKLW